MKQFAVFVVIVVSALCVWQLGPGIVGAQAAPDFTLYPGGSSRTVSLKDYRGKVVVLDFFASWCGPCRLAAPALERINQTYSDKGVVVMGINVNDTANAQDTLSKWGATYTALPNGDAVGAAYGVSGIPTVVVINQAGEIVYQDSGWSTAHEKDVRAAIEKTLSGAK